MLATCAFKVSAFYADWAMEQISRGATSSHMLADSVSHRTEGTCWASEYYPFFRPPSLQRRQLRLLPLQVAQGKVTEGVSQAVCLTQGKALGDRW